MFEFSIRLIVCENAYTSTKQVTKTVVDFSVSKAGQALIDNQK